ncbi:MAG: DUF4271 domain-containing protein [Crocinitomicaceae bacterium]
MDSVVINIVGLPRVVNHLEVLFWPLVFTMILLALVRFRSPKTFVSIFRIAMNNAHMHLHLREGFNVNGIASYLLQFNYFVVIGVLGYCIYDIFSFSKEINWIILFVCLTAPLFFFLIKIFLVRFFAFLVETNQGFFEYLTNYKIFFQLQGILLLPFAVGLVFSDSQTQYYLALITISLFTFLGIFRTALSFLYAIRYGFSVLYIFLYLCTLEILPLVVIFKLFNDRIL